MTARDIAAIVWVYFLVGYIIALGTKEFADLLTWPVILTVEIYRVCRNRIRKLMRDD